MNCRCVSSSFVTEPPSCCWLIEQQNTGRLSLKLCSELISCPDAAHIHAACFINGLGHSWVLKCLHVINQRGDVPVMWSCTETSGGTDHRHTVMKMLLSLQNETKDFKIKSGLFLLKCNMKIQILITGLSLQWCHLAAQRGGDAETVKLRMITMEFLCNSRKLCIFKSCGILWSDVLCTHECFHSFITVMEASLSLTRSYSHIQTHSSLDVSCSFSFFFELQPLLWSQDVCELVCSGFHLSVVSLSLSLSLSDC